MHKISITRPQKVKKKKKKKKKNSPTKAILRKSVIKNFAYGNPASQH